MKSRQLFARDRWGYLFFIANSLFLARARDYNQNMVDAGVDNG